MVGFLARSSVRTAESYAGIRCSWPQHRNDPSLEISTDISVILRYNSIPLSPLMVNRLTARLLLHFLSFRGHFQ